MLYFNQTRKDRDPIPSYREGLLPSAEVNESLQVVGDLLVSDKEGRVYNCHPLTIHEGAAGYPIRYQYDWYAWDELSEREQNKLLDEKGMYLVSVYETNRAYGGPEEGGWWYDTGVPSEDPEALKYHKSFTSHAKALAYREKVLDDIRRLNEDQGRRSPSSVLCNGYFDVQIDCNTFPKPYPQEIPRYE